MTPLRIKKQTKTTLPFLDGYISAGFPSPAENYSKNSISLDNLLITNPPATFMIKVIGDSMIGKSINEGDIVLLDRSIKAKSGDIVLAVYNNEFTIKELEISQNSKLIKLVAANPKYKDILINGEDELVIWGVATKVIHNLYN
jgi:DNA polymerase V